MCNIYTSHIPYSDSHAHNRTHSHTYSLTHTVKSVCGKSIFVRIAIAHRSHPILVWCRTTDFHWKFINVVRNIWKDMRNPIAQIKSYSLFWFFLFFFSEMISPQFVNDRHDFAKRCGTILMTYKYLNAQCSWAHIALAHWYQTKNPSKHKNNSWFFTTSHTRKDLNIIYVENLYNPSAKHLYLIWRIFESTRTRAHLYLFNFFYWYSCSLCGGCRCCLFPLHILIITAA